MKTEGLYMLCNSYIFSVRLANKFKEEDVIYRREIFKEKGVLSKALGYLLFVNKNTSSG